MGKKSCWTKSRSSISAFRTRLLGLDKVAFPPSFFGEANWAYFSLCSALASSRRDEERARERGLNEAAVEKEIRGCGSEENGRKIDSFLCSV